MQQVYLVPGFLGFDRVGSLGYFQGVEEVLLAALGDAQGIDAEVIPTDTLASASLPRRARELLVQVRAHFHGEVEAIHFVGHSTGGLDVRLLLEEGSDLDGESLDAEIAGRTRTAISLATPHRGTPVASIAVELHLRLLAAAGAARLLDLPIWKELPDLRRLPPCGWLYDAVSGWIGGRRDLYEYLDEIATDQSALLQLTPAGTHLFGATVRERPGVRYVSFATLSPPPDFPRSDLLYGAAWQLAARHDGVFPLGRLPGALTRRIERELGLSVGAETNDAVVPTLSQLHGQLGGVVLGDHLDVVGLFRREDAQGRGFQPSWLRSGARFGEPRFERLWRAIAAQLAATKDAPPRPEIVA